MRSPSEHIGADRSSGGGRHVERRLMWALLITLAIFLMEIAGGFLSNSLALKSDAGHIFGDVLALAVSLLAVRLSRLPPTREKTFGYHRVEVLAAIFNGTTLFILALYIFFAAYKRLVFPEPVLSPLMLVVALIGLAANIIVISRLHSIASESLNIRAAFLHVLGDMLASVGVVAGALVILLTGNYLADPIISFFVGAIILYGAWGVLREGAHILLEGVPRSIDYDELRRDMEAINGVVSVHNLHVWTISSSNLALSAHVMIPDLSTHSAKDILQTTNELLSKKYNIRHSTLQFECQCCASEDSECIAAQ